MKKLILTTAAIFLASQVMASDEIRDIQDAATLEDPARKTWVLVIETSRGVTHLPEHMHESPCKNALAGIDGELYNARAICLNFATGEVIS